MMKSKKSYKAPNTDYAFWRKVTLVSIVILASIMLAGLFFITQKNLQSTGDFLETFSEKSILISAQYEVNLKAQSTWLAIHEEKNFSEKKIKRFQQELRTSKLLLDDLSKKFIYNKPSALNKMVNSSRNTQFLLKNLLSEQERDPENEEIIDFSDEINYTLGQWLSHTGKLNAQNTQELAQLLKKKNKIVAQAYEGAFLWIVPIFIALIFSLFKLNSFLKAPITELAEASHKIRAGDFDISLPVAHDAVDEISLLKRNFNITSRRLKMITSELVEINEELKEKNEKMEALASQKVKLLRYLGHEMRAPLGAISSLSELIIEGMTGEITLKQEDYLNRIHSSSDYLLKMVNDLVDQAKLEANMLTLNHSECKLSDIVNSCIDTFEMKALEAGVVLNKECLTDERIWIDPIRIKQVIINIIANALKFTPEGGSIHVKQAWNQEKQEASVSISDTGIGIPEDKMEIIFQEFQQVQGEQLHKGAGLGLSLSKHIMQLHDGDIKVESSLKEGSTFTIYLPKKLAK